jgi:hypothetical protein
MRYLYYAFVRVVLAPLLFAVCVAVLFMDLVVIVRRRLKKI